MTQTRAVHIIGVPLDHGAGRRGVSMGPAALRIAGLHAALRRLRHDIVDLGDLEIPAPETQPEGEGNAKFLSLIAKTCTELAVEVERVMEQGGLPLVLGGDHSLAVGSISGISNRLRLRTDRTPPRLAVVWFDAHGDINNPETSPTGNVHGMPVSCLLAHGPEALSSLGYSGPKFAPEMFFQIGLRDLDDTEKRLIRQSGIVPYTMADIDKRGMSTVMAEVLRATESADWLHVSFDIDAVDPRVAPGTGTPKLGGLTYREAHLAMEMIAETDRLGSLDMVEVNPTLDSKNSTAELAVDLIASALGKRIL
jgi:arginase